MMGNSLCHYSRGSRHLRSIHCPLDPHSAAVTACSALSLHWWPFNYSWLSLTTQEAEKPPILRAGVLGTCRLFHNLLCSSFLLDPQILPIYIPSLEGMETSRLPACCIWAKWFCQTNLCGQRATPWQLVQVLLHPGHSTWPACSILLLFNRKSCWAWKLLKSQCPGYFLMIWCEMERRISRDFHYLCLPATRAGPNLSGI